MIAQARLPDRLHCGGQRHPDETPLELSTRLLAEIRAQAPRMPTGRKPRPAAEQAPVG
jgi:hypothetical protein